MQRKIEFSEGEFYHIYNRGADKIDIFVNDSDKDRFLKLLFVCNNIEPITFRSIKNLSLEKIERGETLVDIGAYCLMSNHFHLLLREKTGDGITVFMKKLLTAYSMYFNTKHERTGVLFQGRFKAEHADSDEYLKYLFSYIHLNPVKMIDAKWRENGIVNHSKAERFLEKYEYSSYLDYLNYTRDKNLILNKKTFPSYFGKPNDFKECVREWLLFKHST